MTDSLKAELVLDALINAGFSATFMAIGLHGGRRLGVEPVLFDVISQQHFYGLGNAAELAVAQVPGLFQNFLFDGE